MSQVIKIKPSESKHFVYNNKEFEIRITDEGDKLEIWEVEFDSSGKCIGFKDIVAEFYLEEVKDDE
tara:strand:+ start:495 stop:692 length:198 start_codon:yes stop_codon:yes gene_type:complete